MKQFLRDSYTSSKIFEHTWTKTGLSIDNMNQIDWDNLGITLEQQQLFNKVRLVKFVHNWLNTGHQKKQINKMLSTPVQYVWTQKKHGNTSFSVNTRIPL
eukprot:6954538-Ditylum_brightwellii.AAC.1